MASQYFLVGMESYRPYMEGQKLDLREGCWCPDLQMAGAYMDVAEVHLPFDGDSSVPRGAQDRLNNAFDVPVIVKSLTFNWTPAFFGQDYSRAFLTIDVYGGQRDFSISDSPLYVPPQNSPDKLAGFDSAAAPLVIKLAAPCRLEDGESIYTELALADDETTFLFSGVTQSAGGGDEQTVPLTADHCFFGYGVHSGNVYTFANAGVASGIARETYQNEYNEPVNLTHLALLKSAAAVRPIGKVAVGGRGWTRNERPLWLFASPCGVGRFDMGYLPAGGMVLLPGEQLDIRLKVIAK